MAKSVFWLRDAPGQILSYSTKKKLKYRNASPARNSKVDWPFTSASSCIHHK